MGIRKKKRKQKKNKKKKRRRWPMLTSQNQLSFRVPLSMRMMTCGSDNIVDAVTLLHFCVLTVIVHGERETFLVDVSDSEGNVCGMVSSHIYIHSVYPLFCCALFIIVSL